MFELCGADGPIRLSFLRVGDKRIAAGIHIEDANGYQYYNAGIDPDAFDLSPGVLLVYAYIRQALERGISRFDFLRGDEPYKYEWGAVDEPIQRILVRRGDG
jgi:CelD/BcsL family acetyltransferase involved in cellulose biosynthesis